MNSRVAAALIVVFAVGAGVVAHSASRQLSATFDEVVLVSGGVRGLLAGRWEMVTDQPPLMMYAYGMAAKGAVTSIPPETRPWEFNDRWTYSRGLLYRLGNDPLEVLSRARAVSAGVAALLVLLVGAWAWWVGGPAAGVFGAGMLALFPDLLAHGGIAYNDVPTALGFVLSLWSMDAWLRRPGPRTALLAAGGLVVAFGMKLSALALLPAGAVLLAMEGWARRRDRGWWRDLAVSGGVLVACLYVGFVLLYRGDPALTLLRFNFWRTVLHASGGHEASSYLMGATSATGWWYYFPVAWLLKTPVALQALVLLGLGGVVRTFRAVGVKGALQWKGRAAAVGGLVFLAFLMRSDLNAGLRYALPLTPLLVVVAAAGLGTLVDSGRRWFVGVGVALLVFQAASVLPVYPHFIAYGGTWAGGPDELHRSLLDSNLDWGQGLLGLQDFMEEEGVQSVNLSYFGSSPPDAYGIEYVALPSFLPLSPTRTDGAEASPRFTVISATNLYGLYFGADDPFAEYREREPYSVIGHSMFVFDEGS